MKIIDTQNLERYDEDAQTLIHAQNLNLKHGDWAQLTGDIFAYAHDNGDGIIRLAFYRRRSAFWPMSLAARGVAANMTPCNESQDSKS